MLYLHVPFCKTRCIYCDFFSTTQNDNTRNAYVKVLCRELQLRSKEWREMGNKPVRSVYFGGGTPSRLSAAELEEIMSCIHCHYPLPADVEITLEANPDDITEEYIQALTAIGINRLSYGVQSFSDATLRLLHRRHTAQQALEAIDKAHQGGITNVSIDLMFGLPGQSITDWEQDLSQAFALPITHLSAYALTIEEGTPIAHMIERKELKETDEDIYVSEFKMLMQAAHEHRFEHYEISNFARPTFHSRHNSGYWTGTPYLGVGAGAHSFDGHNRRVNRPNLQAYIQANGLAPHDTEILTTTEQFNEQVFTALRTANGLHLHKTLEHFPPSWTDELIQTAKHHIALGNLVFTADKRIVLTPKGILVSDDVMSDLMRV